MSRIRQTEGWGRRHSSTMTLERGLGTAFDTPGWCTVLHSRSAFRRGFFDESFLERFEKNEDKFLDWVNDPALKESSDFSKWPWSGKGLLGHPHGSCWWVPFSALKNLHPLEITSHLSLGPHYLESYFIFHVGLHENQPNIWQRPSDSDYRNIPQRIDPNAYPQLRHDWAGSLISIVPT